MAGRLNIEIPAAWRIESEGGPNSFVLTRPSGIRPPASLVLALAARRKRGDDVTATDDELLEMAEELVRKSKFKVLSRSSGATPWGRFGCATGSTVAFTSKAWVISKGPDSVVAVYVGSNPPTKTETAEVEAIVTSISVAG